MRNIREIKEGFFDTSGAGREALLKKRLKELGVTKYDIIDGEVEVFSLYIQKFKGEELGITFSCVEDNITIEDCPNLKTLKGLPSDIASGLNIKNCPNLENLLGSPKKVDMLYLENLPKLKDMTGCPEYVHFGIDIIKCSGLRDMRGLAQNGKFALYIHKCNSLQSLSGCSSDIDLIHLSECNIPTLTGSPYSCRCLTIDSCKKLKDLVGGPKNVREEVEIINCTQLSSMKGLPLFIGNVLSIELVKDFEWDADIEAFGMEKGKKGIDNYITIDCSKAESKSLIQVEDIYKSIKHLGKDVEINVNYKG